MSYEKQQLTEAYADTLREIQKKDRHIVMDYLIAIGNTIGVATFAVNSADKFASDGNGWKYAGAALAFIGFAMVGAAILKSDKNKRNELLEKKNGLEAKLKEPEQ